MNGSVRARVLMDIMLVKTLVGSWMVVEEEDCGMAFRSSALAVS